MGTFCFQPCVAILKDESTEVVVLRGTLPPGLEMGTTFTVNINPSVDDRELVGFGTTFRIAPWSQVVSQSLDLAAAAFGDISTFAEIPSARRLFCALDRGCGGAYSLTDLARYLMEQRETIESLAGELSDLPAAAATGAVEALRLLLS